MYVYTEYNTVESKKFSLSIKFSPSRGHLRSHHSAPTFISMESVYIIQKFVVGG